ncbi:MAG: phage terminase large subunit family protein [Porticoccaceae bacterium]|nr:phage terminase large subunit family protein [Porticoccaceae bacterium]
MTSYQPIEPLLRDLGGNILSPPERLTVGQSSEKYRRLNNKGAYVGAWSNDKVPYLVDIMAALTSRDYQALCFATSAQSAKTEVILNWLAYTAKVDGADMLIYEKSEKDAQDFSERRVDRLHLDSPEIGACLLPGKSSDRVFTKFYRNGSMVSFFPPTKNSLAGKPSARVGLTDYDRWPLDIGGDGTGFDLARGRTRTFRSFGMCYVESSPSHPITDPKWRQNRERPHEAPPCEGILGIYNRGNRQRRYWQCWECEDWFEPDDEHCEWEPTSDLVARAQSVVMRCPLCRYGIITQAQKLQRDRAGHWLIEGQKLDKQGRKSGDARQSDIASFYLLGIAAAFNDWEKMFLGKWQAEEELASTGSERALKSKINIDFGKPYLSKSRELERSPDELMDRASDYGERVIPEHVRFIVAAVDVQNHHFEVQIHGLGIEPDAESWDVWLIDRYMIKKSKRRDDDDERLAVNPGAYAEDWDLITEQVIKKSYPLADDSGRRMAMKMVGVDSGGKAGATNMAYRYHRRLRKVGLHQRLLLLKGEPKPNAPRIEVRFPDNSSRKNRHAYARGETPLLHMNSDVLKDWLNHLLDREITGGGFIHFPQWFVERKAFFFDELCLETRDEKGHWSGAGRNESWDLLYYFLALVLHLGCERVNWQQPPPFCRPWDENPLVSKLQKDNNKTEKRKSLAERGASLL